MPKEPLNKSVTTFQARSAILNLLFEFKFHGIRSFAVAQDDTYSDDMDTALLNRHRNVP